METVLILAGLCVLSFLSTFLIPGHFKVNTSVKGYTVQVVILRSKAEAFICKRKLLLSRRRKHDIFRTIQFRSLRVLFPSLTLMVIVKQLASMFKEHIDQEYHDEIGHLCASSVTGSSRTFPSTCPSA
ncbi:MAG: hypothetical protein JXA45_05685 [Methanomassiliicoccales archaeon]|nr:hypothetical protein [Methanomassiliicoccales archaeon]